jgi:RNA polymerase sigma factor (sigma-70 family)
MASPFDVPLPEGLVPRLRRGEAAAQETVYRLFEAPVYSLLRRMTGDPDTALDLLQDTFLKAFERVHQYRGEAPLGRWLRSIAASEALMHLRRGRHFMQLFYGDASALESVPCHDASDTDLERALSLLDSVPRSVLWLYHVEGYTHVEIAAMCGKTVSFSKSQLSRAHQKLKSLLDTPRPAGHAEPQVTPCTAESARTI